MNDCGAYLKTQRERRRLTLKQVAAETGVTDSRLCRIEKGERECPATDLRKLAVCYGVPVIEAFLKAGYLKPEDLNGYARPLRGTERLDEAGRAHVQAEIDFLLNKGRTS